MLACSSRRFVSFVKQITRKPLALALAATLLAHAPYSWSSGFGSSLSGFLQQAMGGSTQGQSAPVDLLQLASPAAAGTAAPAANVNLFKTKPATMRNAASMSRLFAKGSVNGKELITEMREIRKLASSTRSERAFSSLMGAVDSSAASLDFSRLDFGKLVESAGMALLKETRASFSYAALDAFFETMTGDPDALAKETIQLPSTAGLDQAQQQRILNMAALVVGARVANKIADDADKTYANLESEYEKLLKQREKFASILADVVDKRRKAVAARDELAAREMTAELSRHLSPADIEFIDSFGADRPLKEFANDFGMQNLALEFLRRQNPKAYEEYRGKSNELVGRTRAYVKTVGGVLAFGGLLSGFTNELALSSKDKNAQNLIAMLPLGMDFITAALPLMAKNAKTSVSGISVASSSAIGSLFGEKLFRVVDAEGRTETYRKASGVFEKLNENGKAGALRDALFRDAPNGLLYRVYVCDADATGRMLDKVVPSESRNNFGREFMRLNEGDEFYFLNALTKPNDPQQKKLVSEFLARDSRKRASTPIVGTVQQQVTEKYGEWNESQLARLILANHHGPMSHAQMQIGDVMLRLIPTMTAVYEYETYADSCRATAKKS